MGYDSISHESEGAKIVLVSTNQLVKYFLHFMQTIIEGSEVSYLPFVTRGATR